MPNSIADKLVCIDDKFSKVVVLWRGKNVVCKFMEAILEGYKYCKTVMKNHFNKNLFMSVEDEKFQSSNECWILNKLFKNEDKKVRDHDHISGKYRGSAHSDCSINIKLTKKVPVIFNNLRGYESHLIMQEIDKFDVKVNVIPNGLEKYKDFTIYRNLVFISSMQFMNSGLDELAKNLTDNDFKYFSKNLLVIC